MFCGGRGEGGGSSAFRVQELVKSFLVDRAGLKKRYNKYLLKPFLAFFVCRLLAERTFSHKYPF